MLQVRLVEALRPVPGEVRVAEHEAAAVVGRLAAEAVRVRADVAAAARSRPSPLASISVAPVVLRLAAAAGETGSASVMPSITAPELARIPSWKKRR